ncbi:MAG: cadherin domain-containing protein, partial [Cylindrospermopsis raciborskii KL1]|uniref:cadherin domain-containing protein n=1 Tax=Cylindrospermopsis raciborskii TaxID=77022 RepID=UPI001A1A6456
MSTPKLVITPKVLNVSSRTGKINFDYRLDNFTDPAVSSVAMEIYFSSELQIDVNAITIGDNVGTISTGGRIAVADGSNADSDSNTNNSVILTFQPLTTSSTDKSFITIPFVTTGAFDGQAMVNFIARSANPSLSVDAISSVVINNQTPAILEVGPGRTYTTIQAAINAASNGDVIRVLSGIYNENLTINKSITLEGPNKGIKPTTPDINLNGGIQVNQGYRSNVEAWIKGTITVAADGVTIDGFRLRNENGPLQWDGTPDNFKLLNNYVTGYNADKGPRFGDANSNNPTEVVRGWQIDGNYIGGLLGGGGTGGSMYLAGLGNSSIDNNTFWRPRAAHLYLASLTNVTIKGNKFYHGLHAGGANYDGFNQFFSGSGYGGYGYGGYGYGGYGGYGGSYGGGYGRNYWLELKGTNDGVNIVENSGEYNSGGIQLYGEVSDSFQFNNITIEKNTFPANNFINAYIEPSPNNLSGLIPAVMATARVVDNGPSGSNLVVRNNIIEKDLSQLKFTKDHTSSIDVRGNFNGVTIENNNLTSVGTNGGVSLITGLSFYGDLSETVLIKDNKLNGAGGTRGNAAYYGIDFIPNPALLTPAVDGYGTYTGSNLKIEGNTIDGWQVGVVLRNAGQITGNINIAGNTLSNNSFNVFDGINPTITTGQIPYAENQLQGVVLGTVLASDNLLNTDNVGIRQYAIISGNESGFFSINNSTGQVTLTAAGIAAAANNFETLPNTFDLGITVTDAGGLTATQTVTFTVTNVNEAPSFPAPTATFSTAENTTAVGTITAATDPDAGDTLTYTLSGADAAKFNLDATSRVLSFKAAPNFEAPGSAAGNNTYSVTVTATDAGGSTATQTVTVNVTNVNEAPSFAAPTATFSTPENSTAVGTITAATDPDAGDTLTYSLSGADADKFNFDITSRVLSFKTPPNFEAPGSAAGTNAYSVTVTATDAGGLTATQTVTVNVTDVAEVGNPPVITSSSTFSLVENTTAVGTITATDADGDSLTYSISGGADQNLFTINPNTGVLSFKTAPNFEAPGDAGTNNVYNLQVQVTDGNNPVTQDLIITVTNVNEAPSFAAPTATFSTSENSTSVGTITAATDPDAGDTLTYSLSGADADKFNFDATSRVLSFKTAPNFEAPGSAAGTNAYSVTVTATDAGGLTATQTVTVNVTDV